MPQVDRPEGWDRSLGSVFGDGGDLGKTRRPSRLQPSTQIIGRAAPKALVGSFLLCRGCPTSHETQYCLRSQKARRGAACPLLGVKRTLVGGAAMSAFDPKRTLAVRICRDAQCSLVMFAAILLRSLLDLQPTSERVAKLGRIL